MKKTLCLLFVLMSWTFCQAQKQLLELNLKKGQTYAQSMVSRMTMEQSFSGFSTKVAATVSGKTTYTVTDIQDTIYFLKVKYENLAMKMELPSGVKEFSSEGGNANDPISSLMSSFKGYAFHVEMSRSGKVLSIKNLDSLFIKMTNQNEQLTEEQKNQLKDQLLKTYGEETFKGNLEMATAIFPNRPVGVGDRWTVRSKLSSGMVIDLETTYELKEVTDGHYILSGVANIKSDTAANMGMNNVDLKYHLTGSMTSNLKLDRNTGWMVEGKMNQSLAGAVKMQGNEQMPEGMSIDMKMTGETSYSE